jgi:hypothetical protein
MLGTFGPFDAVITPLGKEAITERGITDRCTVTPEHGQ